VRRWLAALLLVLVQGPLAASAWTLDGEGLTAHEVAASQALLEAAFARMPPAWRDAPRTIDFAWSATLPRDVHGRARGSRVLLARSLLDDWLAAPQRGSTTADAQRAAIATVLHEVAHVHDRGGGHWSREPRLLDLAGWQRRTLTPGLRTRANAVVDRSPDRRELASPAEFWAVNVEHFLLDPTYRCRRPALHRHLAGRLGWSPAGAACGPEIPFVVVHAGSTGGAASVLMLAPSRVQAVDYLLADGDGPPLSRWGHAMLRLVVCAPGRKAGADCRLDLQHHLVLSFRAFVDDVQPSSWRGLTGGYPSRLYALPLDQVIDEYTKVELRGLRSIPLRLDAGEISGLLERAAQLHWAYDGRYRFITNNCAVETWRLLHAGIPRLANADLASTTPGGLLRRLRDHGIADLLPLADPARARRLGYRFEPANAQYDAMFAVARSGLALPAADAAAWMRMPPDARTPWLDRAGLRASAALLLLEEAALRHEQAGARDELKQRLLGSHRARHAAAPTGGGGGVAPTLAAMRAEAGQLARPASLLAGMDGYGLPQAAERAWAEQAARAHGAGLVRLDALLRTQARDWITPARRARLDAIGSNLARIARRLRAAPGIADVDGVARHGQTVPATSRAPPPAAWRPSWRS